MSVSNSLGGTKAINCRKSWKNKEIKTIFWNEKLTMFDCIFVDRCAWGVVEARDGVDQARDGEDRGSELVKDENVRRAGWSERIEEEEEIVRFNSEFRVWNCSFQMDGEEEKNTIIKMITSPKFGLWEDRRWVHI